MSLRIRLQLGSHRKVLTSGVHIAGLPKASAPHQSRCRAASCSTQTACTCHRHADSHCWTSSLPEPAEEEDGKTHQRQRRQPEECCRELPSLSDLAFSFLQLEDLFHSQKWPAWCSTPLWQSDGERPILKTHMRRKPQDSPRVADGSDVLRCELQVRLSIDFNVFWRELTASPSYASRATSFRAPSTLR